MPDKCGNCGQPVPVKIEYRDPAIAELIVILVAVLAPFFFMAGDLTDMDEVMKSGVGIAVVGGVLTVYRIWKHRPGEGEDSTLTNWMPWKSKGRVEYAEKPEPFTPEKAYNSRPLPDPPPKPPPK